MVTHCRPFGSNWFASWPQATSSRPGREAVDHRRNDPLERPQVAASPFPAGISPFERCSRGRPRIRPRPGRRSACATGPTPWRMWRTPSRRRSAYKTTPACRSVVDDPVQDRHAVEATAAGMLGSKGRVVEEAVAVGLGRLGVVPGRADGRVGDLGLRRRGRLPAGQGGPRCQRGRRRVSGRPGRSGEDGRRRGRTPGSTRRRPRRARAATSRARVRPSRRRIRGASGPLRGSPSCCARGRSSPGAAPARQERRRRLLEDAAPGLVPERVVVPEEVHRQRIGLRGGLLPTTKRWAAASVSRRSRRRGR